MDTGRRAAGIAGIAAGAGLALEFTLFVTSGWTPETFGDPATALGFLETGGSGLRAAAFVGLINLGLTIVFLAGLAGTLHRGAPTRAAATLYVGMAGLTAHALVPLGFWLGTPTFLDLAARDAAVAVGGWAGFASFLDAAGGVGYLFEGVAFMAAGSAIIASRRLPPAVGWVGLVGGFASALTVLAADTPLEAVAAGAYMPALFLIIVFRIWAGAGLWREAARSQIERPEAAAASTAARI